MLTLQQSLDQKAVREVVVTDGSWTGYLTWRRVSTLVANSIWPAGVTSNLTRIKVLTPYGGTDLRIVANNWQFDAGYNDADPLGPLTCTAAALELSNGVILAADINGQSQVVLSRDGMAVYDPLPATVAASDFAWIRSNATFAGTLNFGVDQASRVAGGACDISASSSGTVFSGSIANNNSYGWFPHLLIGKLQPGQASVAILGDSIAPGYATNINSAMPVLRLDASGFQFADAVGGARGQWMRLAKYSTHALVQLGRNDASNDASLATMKARAQAVWNYLNACGVRIIAVTVTPNTTSTDGWVTVDNQEVANAGQEAIRVAYNDWLRTLPSPVQALIDGADALESARNSGKFKAGYTDEGLHPNNTGKAALAALVSPTTFTFTETVSGDPVRTTVTTTTTLSSAAWATTSNLTGLSRSGGKLTLAVTHKSSGGPSFKQRLQGSVDGTNYHDLESSNPVTGFQDMDADVGYLDGSTPMLFSQVIPPGLQAVRKQVLPASGTSLVVQETAILEPD